MNSFLELVTLLKMFHWTFSEVFFKVLGIFVFCLKVSEDFFYHGTSMLLQNISLYVCSNNNYVVHGLFKIIQNYVKNKIKIF